MVKQNLESWMATMSYSSCFERWTFRTKKSECQVDWACDLSWVSREFKGRKVISYIYFKTFYAPSSIRFGLVNGQGFTLAKS